VGLALWMTKTERSLRMSFKNPAPKISKTFVSGRTVGHPPPNRRELAKLGLKEIPCACVKQNWAKMTFSVYLSRCPVHIAFPFSLFPLKQITSSTQTNYTSKHSQCTHTHFYEYMCANSTSRQGRSLT
jgi:hypothetical protein